MLDSDIFDSNPYENTKPRMANQRQKQKQQYRRQYIAQGGVLQA